MPWLGGAVKCRVERTRADWIHRLEQAAELLPDFLLWPLTIGLDPAQRLSRNDDDDVLKGVGAMIDAEQLSRSHSFRESVRTHC